MEKVKRMLKKIFFMPPLPALFIIIPSFALVFWVLIKRDMPPAVAYLSYALSFYAMILTVIKSAGAVKWIQKGVGRRIKGDADRRLFFRTAEMTLHSQGVNRRILPIMRHAEGVY